MTARRLKRERVTDEFVGRVADDLRERYALDAEDVRALGARLAEDVPSTRSKENAEFARRFTGEHRATFSRLAQ